MGYGVERDVGAEHHEAVVHAACVFVRPDVDALLAQHVAGVDGLLEEEGGDACLGVAVHDSAVDGRGSAVARQERCVEVEGAEFGHAPHYFGEHSEGYDNEQVGAQSAQFFHEFGGFKPLGLHQVQAVGKRVVLYGRLDELVASSGDFVGHRDDAHHVVAFADYAAEAFDGKLGCAEEYYAEVFFLHYAFFFLRYSNNSACMREPASLLAPTYMPAASVHSTTHAASGDEVNPPARNIRGTMRSVRAR